MNVLLRGILQPVARRTAAECSAASSPAQCFSFHSSAVVQTIRWKRYQWTPWPWPLGLKNVKSRWLKHRPGKVKIRKKDHQPGSEQGQITGPFLNKCRALLLQEAAKLLALFARQCEVYAAQRVRRTQQMLRFYSHWYSRPMMGCFLLTLTSRTFNYLTPKSLMSFVGAAVFALEKSDYTISENELQSCVKNLEEWSQEMKEVEQSADWENVAKHPFCHVWQKSPANSNPPEYRALGTFLDVPARVFFQTQLDVKYRKQWDKLVIKLDIIDKDQSGQTEILHWVSHYPFPFHPREYVFQRRHCQDDEQNVLIVVSKSCDHPKCPLNPAYVRVKTYYSALVIRPHRSFDENGFDYVLMYTDDPQTFLPKMAVQYAARSNLPEFIMKLHRAAKALLQNPSQIVLQVPASDIQSSRSKTDLEASPASVPSLNSLPSVSSSKPDFLHTEVRVPSP